jgi:hypothetical protein
MSLVRYVITAWYVTSSPPGTLRHHRLVRYVITAWYVTSSPPGTLRHHRLVRYVITARMAAGGGTHQGVPPVTSTWTDSMQCAALVMTAAVLLPMVTVGSQLTNALHSTTANLAVAAAALSTAAIHGVEVC